MEEGRGPSFQKLNDSQTGITLKSKDTSIKEIYMSPERRTILPTEEEQ